MPSSNKFLSEQLSTTRTSRKYFLRRRDIIRDIVISFEEEKKEKEKRAILR